MSPAPQILILAAGASVRMRGADKCLEDVDGVPLIARVAQTALATGHAVSVALPPDRPLRNLALAGLVLTHVTVPDPGAGLAASVLAGLAALPLDAPVLIVLADMPEVTTDDLRLMLAEAARSPGLILRGADVAGRPGHPVLMPVWLRAEAAALAGDEGLRPVLARHKDRLRLIALPGHHATTDLDTPEDWAQWRAARQAANSTRAS